MARRAATKDDDNEAVGRDAALGAVGTVTVPRAQWDDLLDHVEDMHDALRIIQIKRQEEFRHNYVPGEVVRRIIAGDAALLTWREHRGLTREELAAQSGVPVATIVRGEAGEQIGADDREKLAGALGLSYVDLLH